MSYMTEYGGLPTRYWGPFKQQFYSLHSFSYPCETANKDGTCDHGRWSNCLMLKISHYMHKNHYSIWHAWANRKYFNGDRKFLKKHFPNLR